MAFELKTEIGGTYIDVALQEQINVLQGISGEGKTYLFYLMSAYAINNDIPMRVINSQLFSSASVAVKSEEVCNLVLSICKDVDVLILDNADLYLTHELLEKLKKFANTIIISIKNSYGVCGGHLCHIKYEDEKIILR
jgi:hypothetical protein